jgi:hypothetical protein
VDSHFGDRFWRRARGARVVRAASAGAARHEFQAQARSRSLWRRSDGSSLRRPRAGRVDAVVFRSPRGAHLSHLRRRTPCAREQKRISYSHLRLVDPRRRRELVRPLRRDERHGGLRAGLETQDPRQQRAHHHRHQRHRRLYRLGRGAESRAGRARHRRGHPRRPWRSDGVVGHHDGWRARAGHRSWLDRQRDRSPQQHRGRQVRIPRAP